jgi:ABC-type transporter Mla subunit MlaD
MSTTPSDPMEFLKSLWGNSGMPLPGLVTPTLDTNELEKRIADLKAVEGWLKTNLNMLQMTIQGLEMQRATLSALQAISQSGSSPDANANPFANPALWPWNFMQGAGQTPAADAPATPATAEPAPPKAGGKAK